MFGRKELKIYTPAAQNALVRATDNYSAYYELHEQFFGRASANLFTSQLELAGILETSAMPNFYRVSTLLAVRVREYGLSSMATGFQIHDEKGYKRPMLGLPHQLALLAYFGSLNDQANPIKGAWAERIEQRNPEAATGILGLGIYIKNGTPIVSDEFTDDQLVDWGELRFNSEEPICLPYTALNRDLRAIDMSRDHADSVTEDELLKKYYPKFTTAIKELLDPEVLLREYASSPLG